MADNNQPLFSSFKRPPAPAAPAPAPVHAQTSPADAAKLQALEKAVAALKAELAEVKAQPKPLPPAGPAEAAADRVLTEAQRPDFRNIKAAPPEELTAQLMKAWAVIEAYKTKTASHDVKLGGVVKFTEELAARVSGQEQKLGTLVPASALDEIRRTLAASEQRLSGELKKFDERLAEMEIKLGGAVKLAEEVFAKAVGLGQRLDALPAPAALEEMGKRLAAAEAGLAGAAKAGDVGRLESGLAGLGERLETSLAAQAERLEARMTAQDERLGARITAQDERLGARIDRQDERLNDASGAVAPAEAIKAMRVQVDGMAAGFADLGSRTAAYLAQFDAIERECRAAAGEVKGFFEKVERDPGLERLDAALKDAVARLEAKLAGAEVKIHENAALLAARVRRAEEAGLRGAEELAHLEEKTASFSDEFTAVQRECRAALGEMNGLLEKAEHSAALARLDSYVKDMFGRLEAKLASAELTLHEAVGSLAARVKAADDANDKKIAETGEKLEKEALAELRKFAAERAEAGKEAAWLKEEYQVRLSRQLREMEARYSALTALSKRVDLLAETLENLKSPAK